MSHSLSNKGRSLQFLLTVLISILVLLTALVLGVFYYRAMQEQLINAQRNLFLSTTAQITSNIKESGARAIAVTNLLANSGLAQAHRVAEQNVYIAQLVASLQGNETLQAVYVGFQDGRFFQVRRIDQPTRALLPEASAKAQWIIQRVVKQELNASAQTVFTQLDDALQRAGPDIIRHKPYDPRQRPWYKMAQASKQIISTPPYKFSTTGLVGITYAAPSPDFTAVIGADIRLDSVKRTLQKNQPSPHAQMALINGQHEILVSTDTDEVTPRPVTLTQASSAVFAALGKVWLVGHMPPSQLMQGGVAWDVSVSPLSTDDGQPSYLLMLMPDRELYADGQRMTAKAAQIPFFILLLMLPLGWFLSSVFSRPIRALVEAAERIQAMDFSQGEFKPTQVRELNELMQASETMQDTIRDFIGLSQQIVAESGFEQLLKITLETCMRTLPSYRGGVWLMEGEMLTPAYSQNEQGVAVTLGNLSLEHPIVQAILCRGAEPLVLIDTVTQLPQEMANLLPHAQSRVLLFPLCLESKALLGLLVLSVPEEADAALVYRLSYLKALVSFAAIAIDNRRLALALQQLMNALVELIAGAIDAKSSYTGGHCQRVPAIAQALAEAANNSQEGMFSDFTMSTVDQEALYIASWLHDCGKVTTPEYVVDKATKLETLYDRIHEVRMRFEVLKRDADIAYWQALASGGDAPSLARARDTLKTTLDEEFAFVAHCNQGSEFMGDEDLARLQRIAQRDWLRTLDDRLGLGPMVLRHLAAFPHSGLPVREPLLSDRPEHRIERSAHDQLDADKRWGFNMSMPELLYHHGELTNLSVRRGTLTEEERYKINEHIVVTIKMLGTLPFPSHLQQVPEIAGGHHERIDGKGYPHGLKGEDMSVLARIMAIADVFEALTASDRPYKSAKTMAEALTIMSRMVKDKHLDRDLYCLFLESGLWRDYGERFLLPQQCNVTDIQDYFPA